MLLLTATLGGTLAAPPLLAQSKKNLRVPPIAVSTNVPVWRGGTVEIPLRGFQANNPVTYEIKDPPQHGRLSAITQPDPDRVSVSTDGSVFYTHDNSDDSGADKFTFRARAVRGGGLSAPATVRLTIRDRPPVLTAPAALNFQAAAGESMTLPLGLTNAGGGSLQIDCRAKPPFEILGEQPIELPRGASTNVMVRYAPETAGQEARQTLQPGVNDSTGAQIVLRGRPVAPFEVEKSGGAFVVEGPARVASLSLRSRATGRQDIAVTSEPAGLVEIPSSVELPPGTSAPVELRIPAERKGEGQEVTVTFSTASHREQATLVAPPVPAELQVITAQLDYTGGGNAAILSVTNSGGVPGHFRLEPVPGLFFSTGAGIDAREFEVEPDRQTDVDIRLDLPSGEEPPAVLLVDLGSGQMERIVIRAPLPTPVPSPTASPPTPPRPPPPPPKPFKLNKDVRLAAGEAGLGSIELRYGVGEWREPQLEVYRGGRWTPAPEPPRGIMQRFGDWISGFFGSLIPQPGVTLSGSEPTATAKWAVEATDSASAPDKDARWRITAKQGADGVRQPVSEEFRIDWVGQKLLKAETLADPAPVAAPSVAPPGPAAPAPPAPATGARALKVETARAEPRRNSATVQVLFTRDPEATGYRLEHGSHAISQDEETGMLRVGEFLPHPHPSATATVLGTSEAAHDGRRLTALAATIEGLEPGTSTTWRVVTMAGADDLRATSEFTVRTLPPWQFPRRQALLVAALFALAAILYLRWRVNRAPR
jgi:hypothetical protein